MHIILDNKEYKITDTLHEQHHRKLCKVISLEKEVPYLLYIHKEQCNQETLNTFTTNTQLTNNISLVTPLLHSTLQIEQNTYDVSLCNYPSGSFFSDYIHLHKISERTKIDLFSNLVTSVHQFHQNNMLHNAIVPNNVFIQKNKKNLTLTLGLPHFYSNTHLDKHNVFDNNIYTNPYILLDIFPSISTDIYSLGVIGYYLFALQFPYEGSTLEEFMSNYRQQSLIGLDKLLYCNPEYTTIIHNMILNPHDPYYTSIEQIIKDWNIAKKHLSNYNPPLKELYDQLAVYKSNPPTPEHYKLCKYYYQKILGYGIITTRRDIHRFLDKSHTTLPHSLGIKEQYEKILTLNSAFQDLEEVFSLANTAYNLIQEEEQIFDNLESLYKKIKENYIVIETTLKELSVSSNKLTNDLLGYLYINGITKSCDSNKSIHYYLESAKAGNHSAYTQIAFIYGTLGGKKNMKHAIQYYSQAAELNEPVALYELAEMYLLGDSYREVPQNIPKALEYYKRSAELGEEEAHISLALFYKKGKYVEKNYNKSYQHLLNASRQGSTEADYLLGNYAIKGIGCDKDLNKAIYYYRKAAHATHMDALCTLGTYYAKGIGVTKDKKKAKKYLQQASDYGIRKAWWQLLLLPFR